MLNSDKRSIHWYESLQPITIMDRGTSFSLQLRRVGPLLESNIHTQACNEACEIDSGQQLVYRGQCVTTQSHSVVSLTDETSLNSMTLI